jgi:hypothetical protein
MTPAAIRFPGDFFAKQLVQEQNARRLTTDSYAIAAFDRTETAVRRKLNKADLRDLAIANDVFQLRSGNSS